MGSKERGQKKRTEGKERRKGKSEGKGRKKEMKGGKKEEEKDKGITGIERDRKARQDRKEN